MQGEINVIRVMDRVERLKVWHDRQLRDAEWVALKQWWRAERAVRRARTPATRSRARLARAKTGWLYRHELRRAWPNWHVAQAQRAQHGAGRSRLPPVAA